MNLRFPFTIMILVTLAACGGGGGGNSGPDPNRDLPGGSYGIDTDPNLLDKDYPTLTHEGNMQIISQAGSPTDFWCQSFDVSYSSQYIFSAEGRSLSDDLVTVEWRVNGQEQITQTLNNGDFQTMSFNWSSHDQNTVELCGRSTTTVNGAPFVIDNIAFLGPDAGCIDTPPAAGDDCSQGDNGNVRIFDDRATFVAATSAASIGDYPSTDFQPSLQVGNVTISTTGASLYGAGRLITEDQVRADLTGASRTAFGENDLIPENSLLIDQSEDLDIDFGEIIHSFGFNFYEPINTGNPLTGGPAAVDTTFRVTLYNGATVVDRYEFNGEDDVLTFHGVSSKQGFDRAEIREIERLQDNEHFGVLLVGTSSLPCGGSGCDQGTNSGLRLYSDRTSFLDQNNASSLGEYPSVISAASVNLAGGVVVRDANSRARADLVTEDRDPRFADLLPERSLLVSGNEDIDVEFPSDAYSFGFNLYEPHGNSTGPGSTGAIDSTFEVSLYKGTTLVDVYTFNVDNDVAAFQGVSSTNPFDKAEIREIVGGNDNEHYGTMYVGYNVGICGDMGGTDCDVVPMIVTGADGGGGPHVKTYDENGSQDQSFFGYGSGFRGGVSVAYADFNGDGVPDIVTGSGPGAQSDVRVYDGARDIAGNDSNNGEELILSVVPYNFSGGVFVAAGDVNNDGTPDIVTGADSGGGPHVKVFDGTDVTNVLHSFMAYSTSFRGGVRVAVGDINGDGFGDIITGAGPRGGPHVKVFDGRDTDNVLKSFMAYGSFDGGVFVGSSDFNGDGLDDIVTGAGSGGGPHVVVWDSSQTLNGGDGAQRIHNFMAYGSFDGGVTVAATDYNDDGTPDVVTGAGPGGGPHVKVWDGGNGAISASDTLLFSEQVYGTFDGGVFVAGLTSGEAERMCGGGSAQSCFATSVVRHTRSGNGNCPVSAILGEPDSGNPPSCNGWVQFDNEGETAGFVEVALGGRLIDRPGNDVKVWVTDFVDHPSQNHTEQFKISVSDGGSNYIEVAESRIESSVFKGALEFDISGTGLSGATHVRITNSAIQSSDTNDGPDLDAIEGIQCEAIAAQNCFAAEVVSHSMVGWGAAVNVLGEPDVVASDWRNGIGEFASDGGGAEGFVVVRFDKEVLDQAGNDLRIHLYDFTTGENPPERLRVSVSNDGVSFVELENRVASSSTENVAGFEDFDISGSGLSRVTHVKIENGQGAVSDNHEGAEIDAIEGLNCTGSCSNLIQNPSFEDHNNDCANQKWNVSYSPNIAPGWGDGYNGNINADLWIESCGSNTFGGVTTNYNSAGASASDGDVFLNGWMGASGPSNHNGSQYFQGTLVNPLVAGEQYEISFDVKGINLSSSGAGTHNSSFDFTNGDQIGLGVDFSVGRNIRSGNWGSIFSAGTNTVQFDTITLGGNYQRVRKTFTAPNNATNFVMGHFSAAGIAAGNAVVNIDNFSLVPVGGSCSARGGEASGPSNYTNLEVRSGESLVLINNPVPFEEGATMSVLNLAGSLDYRTSHNRPSINTVVDNSNACSTGDVTAGTSSVIGNEDLSFIEFLDDSDTVLQSVALSDVGDDYAIPAGTIKMVSTTVDRPTVNVQTAGYGQYFNRWNSSRCTFDLEVDLPVPSFVGTYEGTQISAASSGAEERETVLVRSPQPFPSGTTISVADITGVLGYHRRPHGGGAYRHTNTCAEGQFGGYVHASVTPDNDPFTLIQFRDASNQVIESVALPSIRTQYPIPEGTVSIVGTQIDDFPFSKYGPKPIGYTWHGGTCTFDMTIQ